MIPRQKKIMIPPSRFYLWLPIILFWAITVSAEYKVILKDGQTMLAKTRPISMEGAYHFRGIDSQMKEIPVGLVDGTATEAANREAGSAASSRKVITNEDLREGSDVRENPSPGEENSNPLPAAGNMAKPAVNMPNRPPKELGASHDDYWRARAQKIRNELAAIEARTKEINDNVAQKKSDPVKYQMGTYSPYLITGDYREELRQLDLRKQKLERDFAELEEEARKAGVPPGALR
jgi:hypothetical protein